MSNADKNILITPNRGSTSGDPRIDFVGADTATAGQTITLNALPINNGTLSFEGSAGQLFSITNDLSGTIFSVNDVSGIPSIEVDADGTVRFAEFSGNVGIGTSSPLAKLHVEDDVSDLVVRIRNTRATGNNRLEFYHKDASDQDVLGYIRTSWWNDAGMTFKTPRNLTNRGFAWLDADQSEVMRLTWDGQLGIGTTNPSSLLHIASTGDAVITIEADTDNVNEDDNPRIEFKQDGSIVTARIGLNAANNFEIFNEYGDANSDILFGTQNTTRMVIGGDGNVGINNTNPLDPLSIVQSSQFGIRLARDGHDSMGIALVGSQRLAFINYTKGSREDLVIEKSNGNVGIGTTAPTERLHVNGKIRIGTQATATTDAVRADRNIASGTGLTGGGNLTADRTFAVNDDVARARVFQLNSLASIVDDVTNSGKAVVLLFPSTGSANHNAMGRVMTQRSSGNRDTVIADFSYSSRSSDPATPDLIMEQTRGVQGIRNRWRFATVDFQGTNWVCLYYDGGQFSISNAFISLQSNYSGNNFLTELGISSVTNLTILTAGYGDKLLEGTLTATGFTGALTGNAATATTLQTARTIGGVSFNGSANINLPGVNTTGNQNTTGSAATLTTARNIALSGNVSGSASFNGSANITITTSLGSTLSPATAQELPATVNLNNLITANAGFYYQTANADTTGNNYPSNEAGSLIVQKSAGNVTQLYQTYNTDAKVFVRANYNTGFGAWQRLYADNYRPRADTLTTARTINGVSFNGSANITLPTVNTAGDQSVAGAKTFTGLVRTRVSAGTFVASGDRSMSVMGNTTDPAVMSFHRAGAYAVQFGLDTDNHLKMGGWSATTVRHTWQNNGNYIASGEVTAFSDIKLKENIEVIADPLTKILSIRGVTFTRNDQEDKETRHMGVIAQEVEKYFPEVVLTDRDGTKSVNYGAMAGAFIEAFKAQQTQIDELRIAIEKLLNK